MSGKKSALVWAALAMAAGLVVYGAPPLDSELVSPTVAAQKRSASLVAATDSATGTRNNQNLMVLKIRSRDSADDTSTSFAPQQWTLPVKAVAIKPQAVASQPEPLPQAPALPFRFLGRYIEDGQTIVFLLFNEQSLVAKVGDVLQQNYKVQSVTASAMTLVYLPLNQTQTLDIGALP